MIIFKFYIKFEYKYDILNVMHPFFHIDVYYMKKFFDFKE